MKRFNKLFDQICSVENLHLADSKARQGKSGQHSVKAHDRNREANIQRLHNDLLAGNFKTSQYKTFLIFEPKRREIFRLPYYPDRIVHHAIMNVLEPIWVPMFTRDTYSAIKGRGVHSMGDQIRKALKGEQETQYCLKLDIRKFYPSVDHEIMKQIVRRKIKDGRLLSLLDEIIDSAEGLPIGNYLSQFLANLYLSGFDHWIKQQLGVKYYFRYCDDIVILAADKPYLHKVLANIREYLSANLKLEVKSNYQVFPVDKRGIDVGGYRYFRIHTLLRKRIKKSFARAIVKGHPEKSLAAYNGWAKHAHCINLLNTFHKLRNEKLQRFRNRVPNEGFRGRQDQNRPNSQQGNSSKEVQNRDIKVQRQIEWTMFGA